jgi:hypothetical protein
MKVLVLGNDPQINNIDFSRLQRDVITLGVNRIWLKHIPNYFFFNDPEILAELEQRPDTVKALTSMSNCFSSDWLTFSKKKKVTVPSWVNVYSRPNPLGFPDSVTTAISIFRSRFLMGKVATFYIAGVSLKWSEPSHFWKSLDHTSLNHHGPDWYEPRFRMILENFRKLSIPRSRIISVNPDSLLNKHYRYEGIENLYSR